MQEALAPADNASYRLAMLERLRAGSAQCAAGRRSHHKHSPPERDATPQSRPIEADLEQQKVALLALCPCVGDLGVHWQRDSQLQTIKEWILHDLLD